MAVSEGNLEPPKRRPIEWRDPAFYDQDALDKELERVFDVCHGCRRCFNLCTAFPTLFDLVDGTDSGELEGVPKSEYEKVIDRCYLCDMCFMSKCPYVPPHPLNVDFPHLMLRAKAVKFEKHGASFRDRLLSSTDALGKLAAIPVIAQTVNALNRNSVARAAMEKVLRVHRMRHLPPYSARRFRSSAKPNTKARAQDGERTPGRVAIFSTCYVNYNEPGIGHDLVKILQHNGIAWTLIRQESCCGMPKLELGDLKSVERQKNLNLPGLHALVQQGYVILTPVPSCTLMFRQELPLMFPEDSALQEVAAAMREPFEYFAQRHRDGLFRTDFKHELGEVAYHVPCHLRVQNLGLKTRDVLQLVPGTKVHVVERCSGHDGTWGVKEEFFEQSMKIGQAVFKQMSAGTRRYVTSDCAIAGRHIEQGIGATAAEKQHPISLLRIAYGI